MNFIISLLQGIGSVVGIFVAILLLLIAVPLLAAIGIMFIPAIIGLVVVIALGCEITSRLPSKK